MFDSTPSNLPLEPLPETSKPAAPPMPAPSVVPPTMPAPAPRPASIMPSSMSGKKEPEDIFAGIDKPEQEGHPMPSMAPPAPKHGSPLKGILIAAIILIVLGGGGFAAWYFLIREEAAPTPVVTPTPVQPIVEVPPVTEPTPVVTPPVTEPTPTATEPVTTPPAGTNIPPPTSVATPAEAIDADVDGLSDPEEQLLGTNPAITDTDGDGFQDGAEVASGYDPTVPRGVLSMSVWLRKTTIGPNWSFLIPISWTLSADTVPGDYSVQTGTPATFSFHFGTLADHETFAEWLRQNEPTVDASSLNSFQTKLGSAAWQTPDRLTTYVVSGSHVFRIRYQVNGAISYDYRAIYDMMLQQAIVL